MDELDPYVLRPIGVVRSTLCARDDAPNQAFEGAPEAQLEIDPAFADALHRIQPGDELILLTWLHSPTATSSRPTRPETRTSR
jgi:tRNA (Thr-GGU) A37 N-methylase